MLTSLTSCSLSMAVAEQATYLEKLCIIKGKLDWDKFVVKFFEKLTTFFGVCLGFGLMF